MYLISLPIKILLESRPDAKVYWLSQVDLFLITYSGSVTGQLYTPGGCLQGYFDGHSEELFWEILEGTYGMHYLCPSVSARQARQIIEYGIALGMNPYTPHGEMLLVWDCVGERAVIWAGNIGFDVSQIALPSLAQP